MKKYEELKKNTNLICKIIVKDFSVDIIAIGTLPRVCRQRPL